MKFSLSTVLALAAVAIAAPTVEMIERDISPQGTLAANCEAAHGTLACCVQQQTPQSTPNTSAGLLGILGALTNSIGINCFAAVGQILPALCGQANTCCASTPEPATSSVFTGLLEVNPTIDLGNICPAIAA